MAEVRLLQAEEYEEAVRLSDLVFRDAEQSSMGTAFPFVFSPHLGQAFGAFAGGRLVSFMGLVPSVIRVGPARLPVYSLGSVCTHPDHRGKGYASAILEQVQAHVDRAGAALMLISGGRSLYTRNRCYPFGHARRYTLRPALAEALACRVAVDAVRSAGPCDWLLMQGLASGRFTAYEQSVWDLALLVRAEAYASCLKLSHEVLVAERDGRPCAYLVYGVPYRPGLPRDPQAIEWAGDADAVAVLIGHAVQRHGFERFHVYVPWQDLRLQQALAAADSRPQPNQGTVFIPSARRLFDCLHPYLSQRDADLAGSLRVRDVSAGGCELAVGRASAHLDAEAVVAFVFNEPAADGPASGQAGQADPAAQAGPAAVANPAAQAGPAGMAHPTGQAGQACYATQLGQTRQGGAHTAADAAPGVPWGPELEAVRRRWFPLPFPYTVGLNYV